LYIRSLFDGAGGRRLGKAHSGTKAGKEYSLYET